MTERQGIGEAVSEDDLHAYVDGHLAPQRRVAVEAWLALDEAAARQVAAYRTQNELLHALFDPVLSEPLPPALIPLADQVAGRLPANDNLWTRLRRPLMRGAAVAAVVLLTVSTGYLGLEAMPPWLPGASQPSLRTFAEEAVQAHGFYANSRFEVEMGADDPGALDNWLSERLGRQVFAADLAPNGYRLMGGRSLPTDTGVGAQYMYESGEGKRLTVFIGRARSGSPRGASGRFVQEGDLGMVYWIEGNLSYAVVGMLARDELLRVTQQVHRSLASGPSASAPHPAAPDRRQEPPAGAPSNDPPPPPHDSDPTKPS